MDEQAAHVAICDCDEFVKLRDTTRGEGGVYIHTACGRAVGCEFAYLDDNPHPATEHHVDYFTCAEHLGIAINNVADRRM